MKLNHIPTRIFSLSLVVAALPLIAGTQPGYSHDSWAKTSNPAWMSRLRDDVRLHQLSIPGTHDSMALYWGDIVQTQSMPLNVQLQSGIRALDIRLMFIGNSLQITHGVAYQFASLDQVLQTVQSFLSANPREAIIMRVKMDDDSGFNINTTFEQTWRTYWQRYRSMFWTPTSDDPNLGEIRGKVVLLHGRGNDFPVSEDYGIDYSTLLVQDNYSLGTNWDLYNKWTQVKTHLVTANGAVCLPTTGAPICIAIPGSDPNAIYLNFLSGSGGAFPYFVASGKVSPATDAPRLATGKTTPGWNGWPDFPRVNCLGSICTIAFEGTNNLTYNLLSAGIISTRTGILMADFPGPGLIEKVIALNNKFR